jgi:PKD repeat protein/LysM repeat protein
MTKRFLVSQKITRRVKSRSRPRPRASKPEGGVRGLIVRGPAAYAGSALVIAGGALAVFLCLSASKAEVSLPSEPQTVVVDEAPPTGSGLVFNRNQEIPHTVLQGQTFSEIAYMYDIDADKLAAFNRVTDINKIKEGTVIRIPSLAEEKTITIPAVQPRRVVAVDNPARPGVSTGVLKIFKDLQFDGTTVTAHFKADYPTALNLTRFEWSLGDGRKSFRPEISYTYQSPGTYAVTLKATDANGRVYAADGQFVDVPHPTTYKDGLQQFLTLDSVDATFTVKGSIVQYIHYDGRPPTDVPMVLVDSNADGATYKPTRTGYFGFDVEKDGATHHVYVFVSPVDSKHSDRTDLNWYRTQFNTGTQSNCGPTVVSMAISWATGEYIAVSDVRHDIGWSGNGSTGYEDLKRELARYNVEASLVPLRSPEDVFDVIDRGNIAILLFHTGGLRRSRANPTADLFGGYYTESVGHYVIVKGYSKDKRYFIVYDPIPSDWGSNSLRYADGISMIGRNRYYSAAEIFGSRGRGDVIEVTRPAQ